MKDYIKRKVADRKAAMSAYDAGGVDHPDAWITETPVVVGVIAVTLLLMAAFA